MGGPTLRALSNGVRKLFSLAALGFLILQVGLVSAQTYYEPKSVDAAAAFSFFGTAIPVGLALLQIDQQNNDDFGTWVGGGGLLLGPALGYFYADLYKRGLMGVGVRTFIVGGTLAAEEIRKPKK